MLYKLRHNNMVNTVEELNGPFDWNKTTMAPLGNMVAAFVTPDNRIMYTPYTEEVYVVDMAPLHYQLLEMIIPTARGYRLTGMYRLFRCTGPSQPCQNRTIKLWWPRTCLTHSNIVFPPQQQENESTLPPSESWSQLLSTIKQKRHSELRG